MKGPLRRVVVSTGCVLAAVVVALGAAGLRSTPVLEIPAGFEGAHVAVDGLPLRVLQQGAGRDLLMIHGSPGSLEDFASQAGALAGSFRVTRYDRPGHGFSGDGGRYPFAYNAEVALALIERLGLERVVVVGHSYGGSTALALAALRSPRVSAYVVIDSAVYESVRAVAPIHRPMTIPVLGLGLANEHVHSRGELARQSLGYPEIDAPVYFIAQRDGAGRRENALRLRRELPRTVLVLEPDTGHYIQVERPEAVTDLIRRAARESARATPADSLTGARVL